LCSLDIIKSDDQDFETTSAAFRALREYISYMKKLHLCIDLHDKIEAAINGYFLRFPKARYHAIPRMATRRERMEQKRLEGEHTRRWRWAARRESFIAQIIPKHDFTTLWPGVVANQALGKLRETSKGEEEAKVH
jgi:hypothetical protein